MRAGIGSRIELVAAFGRSGVFVVEQVASRNGYDVTSARLRRSPPLGAELVVKALASGLPGAGVSLAVQSVRLRTTDAECSN
jgi:hypothetical protein